MAQQAVTRRVRPTTPADLWRLAEQGHQNGVVILSECVSGERFATSASEPGTIYRLTARSCTFKGFTYHGRCRHHSLLVARLGWLPDPDPTADPPAPSVKVKAVIVQPATCAYCEGEGYVVKRSTINPDQTYRAPCLCHPRFLSPALRPAA